MCNQLCLILFQSVQGVDFVQGRILGFLHSNKLSLLTQNFLHYTVHWKLRVDWTDDPTWSLFMELTLNLLLELMQMHTM